MMDVTERERDETSRAPGLMAGVELHSDSWKWPWAWSQVHAYAGMYMYVTCGGTCVWGESWDAKEELGVQWDHQ